MGNVMINVPYKYDGALDMFYHEIDMKAVTHRFTEAELPEWKGFGGTGLPDGVWDRVNERLYV